MDFIKFRKVWMDFPPEAKIPIYTDKVYVKVLRMPKTVNLTFKNSQFYAEPTKKVKVVDPLLELNNQKSNENLNKFNSSGANTNTESKNMNSQKSSISPKLNKSSNNLINMDTIPSNPSSKKAGFNIENIDLSELGKKLQDSNDFEFITKEKESPNNSKTNSNIQSTLFDAFTGSDNVFGKAGATQATANESETFKKSPLSELGGLDWNSDAKPNATLQNVFSNNIVSSNPIDNIPNNLSEEIIQEKVNEIVKKWRHGVNEKKNLIFILGTFSEIWTQDTMWKEISMQELIEDKSRVKSYYKKALGQTHPDKNMNKDYKIRYLADVLYNILTHANGELPK